MVEAEPNLHGADRRCSVPNRPGTALYPEAAYNDYIRRGEGENRNKEWKGGLEGGRLSDQRFCANYFRLDLPSAAWHLLVRLRLQGAEPPPVVQAPTATDLVARRRRRNARRRDPMGEGRPSSGRMLLIKVAAGGVGRCRRVVVRLSGSWPHLANNRHIGAAVQRRTEGIAEAESVCPTAPRGRRGKGAGVRVAAGTDTSGEAGTDERRLLPRSIEG